MDQPIIQEQIAESPNPSAAAAEDKGNSAFSPPEQLSCRFCQEPFRQSLLRDLHIIAEHGHQWSSGPFYSSGKYTLLPNDLVQIVQSEFESLRDLSVQNVSAPGYAWIPPQEPVNEPALVTGWKNPVPVAATDRPPVPNRSILTKLGIGETEVKVEPSNQTDQVAERRQSEADQKVKRSQSEASQGTKRHRVSSGDAGRNGSSSRQIEEPGQVAKRRRTTSGEVSRNGSSSRKTAPEFDTKQSAESQKKSGGGKWPKTTTFVARSVLDSRRNRLQLAGKPYYRGNDTFSWKRDRPDNNGKDKDSDAANVQVHAFECGIERSGSKKGNGMRVCVFQPKDTADLLRNLTFKTTKAKRQAQEAKKVDEDGAQKAKDESKAIEENDDQKEQETPRFRVRHPNRRGFNGRSNDQERDVERRYGMDEYKRRDERIRRGHLYDAQIDRYLRGSNNNEERTCVTKNALHLYLFKSPAGDRAITLAEAPFWIKDRDCSIAASRAINTAK